VTSYKGALWVDKKLPKNKQQTIDKVIIQRSPRSLPQQLSTITNKTGVEHNVYYTCSVTEYVNKY